LDHVNQTNYAKYIENELYEIRHSLNQKPQFKHPFLKNMLASHNLIELRLLYQEQTHVGQEIYLHIFPMFFFDFSGEELFQNQLNLKDEELIHSFVCFGCDFINRQNGKSHTLGNFIMNYTPPTLESKL
jgi:hypothetical protein